MPTIITPTPPKRDLEIDAMKACLEALLPLDDAARRRIIAYLDRRMHSTAAPPQTPLPPWRPVELWYPGVEGNPLGIEVELHHVRAARDIRVGYDFDRDGFTITSTDDAGELQDENDEQWIEVAFVPAWARRGPHGQQP